MADATEYTMALDLVGMSAVVGFGYPAPATSASWRCGACESSAARGVHLQDLRDHSFANFETNSLRGFLELHAPEHAAKPSTIEAVLETPAWRNPIGEGKLQMAMEDYTRGRSPPEPHN